MNKFRTFIYIKHNWKSLLTTKMLWLRNHNIFYPSMTRTKPWETVDSKQKKRSHNFFVCSVGLKHGEVGQEWLDISETQGEHTKFHERILYKTRKYKSYIYSNMVFILQSFLFNDFSHTNGILSVIFPLDFQAMKS